MILFYSNKSVHFCCYRLLLYLCIVQRHTPAPEVVTCPDLTPWRWRTNGRRQLPWRHVWGREKFQTRAEQTCQNPYISNLLLGYMDAKFCIQIGSDWPQMGQIWGFLRSVSVHFGSPSQNVLKLILKSPRFSHLRPIWPNLVRALPSLFLIQR